MLTMGKPIKLKTVNAMETLGSGFAERITGNYQMLEEHMTPTDMLHFVSAPPEMYMEESGMAPLVNNNSEVNIQNMNMQLINNVLNRILVSEQVEMTYQDRVFIENILNKIGVTNVKEFIRQVNRMKQETHNTRELLTLYQSGNKALKMIQEYRREEAGRQQQKEDGQQTGKEREVYFLQKEVLKRLHTEEIYQEIADLVNIRYGNNTRISRQEMSVSEQSMYAQQLTLNRMRNETFQQDQSLVYNNINTYEAGDTKNVSESYEQTVNSMVEAVLLNAVSQIYHTRYNSLKNNASSWQWLADVLHVNAQNTFQRFENYHNRLNLTREAKEEYHETLQKYEIQEIQSLQRLFHYKEEVRADRTDVKNISQTDLQYRTEENLTEEKEFIENTLNELNENQEHVHQHISELTGRMPEEVIRKEQVIENVHDTEHTDTTRILEIGQAAGQHGQIVPMQQESGNVQDILQYKTEENLTEEKEVQQNRQNELNIRQEDIHKHVFKVSEKQREEEILKQLDIINRNNIERLEKLQTFEREKRVSEPVKINKEQAKKDALRALEHPDEVVMEYLNQTTETETDRVEREHLKEIMGADTVRILETVRDYKEHPERYPNVTTSEGQAMNLLMHDISQRQDERNEQARVEQEQLVRTQVKEENSKEVERVLKETERHQIERVTDRQGRQQEIRQQVELLHKQNESVLNEEILEELENRNRKTVQSEIRTTTEQQQETNHVTQIVTNKVNELRLEQDQNIERIVSQNVKQQLNMLSDQVFNKLEKRMDSERRRRGI